MEWWVKIIRLYMFKRVSFRSISLHYFHLPSFHESECQYLLSWAKYMNVFHCFCESLYKCAYICKHICAYRCTSDFVCLFVCLYFCFAQFILLVYKSLIMVVEIFQKYHWIQHTKTQRVVITRERNKLLWTSQASESLFN